MMKCTRRGVSFFVEHSTEVFDLFYEMAGLAALSKYYGDDDEEQETIKKGETAETSTSINLASTSGLSTNSAFKTVDLAPAIIEKFETDTVRAVDLAKSKELKFNPKYEELFTTPVGPDNPFKTKSQKASKNTLTGFVEGAHVSEFHFETERRTFDSYGYARDPSADIRGGDVLVGDKKKAEVEKGTTVFETTKKRQGDKRQRHWNLDSSDVDGYTGPWGGFVDEQKVAKPDEETLKQMEEFRRKKKKMTKVQQQENVDEKSTLHVKDVVDYQGRSFMDAPHDLDVNLRTDTPPSKCYVPKKQIHTWTGHTKGVQAIRWFPKTAHLLLSCSMDCKVKLWEVYKGRRCIRTYMGHRMAVRDACFNNTGTEFLTTSYDRYIKLWDTETGECKQRFTTGKVPYVVKFNPDDDKQHMFLAGMQDKKIIQWDLRSGEIVQEYDRHMGAVNSITFFDNNRRFCSTSDDKSMRIWEWEIPVDTKLIQDPGMHSLPHVTMAPNQRWVAAQSMDNKVVIFQIVDEKIRLSRKKTFRGHMVSGYACGVDFSPDMSYLASGDADGKVFIWDWKTHRMLAKWKAHDNVCIGVLWHPHETSKVATCGWDGAIKLWD